MSDFGVTAIILAAGMGTRMGAPLTKQRMTILGETVLHRCVRAFCECDAVDSIIVAVREEEFGFAEAELTADFPKLYKIVVGGDTRAASAANAFFEIPKETEYVAIHDCARCLITPEMIEAVITEAKRYGAATAGALVTDTVKHRSPDGMIDRTLNRDELFFASTPQVFGRALYEKALSEASFNAEVTDDNMMIERIGGRIAAVDVGKENIKITTMQDIEYAEFLIMKRQGLKMGQTRIGHGYDVHKFADGRRLILGGVEIPYVEGLLGHSDADVLTHAVMDALLGAAALGDIGRHFPDTSDEFLGISSIDLLRRVKELLSDRGCKTVNIDATLVMQKPKIAEFVPQMIHNIAEALEVPCDLVNIKATTEEHLGFTGSGEGAAAHAVAMIEKE